MYKQKKMTLKIFSVINCLAETDTWQGISQSKGKVWFECLKNCLLSFFEKIVATKVNKNIYIYISEWEKEQME